MTRTKIAKVEPVDMKLEVVVLGVSDVDRTKAFYENLGWRLDIDLAQGDAFRVAALSDYVGRWMMPAAEHRVER
jgi:catechol 2,3-dioxygenase-like lactoylglutathione lyase family enzyme